MKIRNREFDVENRTYIMGILNITPDSFSDGGNFQNLDRAVKRALEMEKEGAAIIDIGGESTRPGFVPVSADEELSRLLPVVSKIRDNTDLIISIDTTKPLVAKECIKLGADMINDISFMKNAELIKEAAAGNVAYCLMHNKAFASMNNSNKDNINKDNIRKNNIRENNIREEFIRTEFLKDMKNAILKLEESSLDMSKLIIDPGIGFAKNDFENLAVIRAVSELKKFNYPVLLAASRKSFIGNILNLPVEERLEGTLAVTAYVSINKIPFVRVHDVKENYRLIRMLETINKETNI